MSASTVLTTSLSVAMAVAAVAYMLMPPPKKEPIRMEDIPQESAGVLVSSKDGFALVFVANPFYVNKNKGETETDYKAKKPVLEVPGGKMEPEDNGDPVACARREFKEEVGRDIVDTIESLDIPYTTTVMTMVNPGRGTPDQIPTKQTLVAYTVETKAQLKKIMVVTDNRVHANDYSYLTTPQLQDRVMVHGVTMEMYPFWNLVHGSYSIYFRPFPWGMRKWSRALLSSCLSPFIPDEIEHLRKGF